MDFEAASRPGTMSGEIDLLFVDRLQDVDVLELQRAIVRRLAEVETGAAGRLQLVDLLLVLRERRRVDLDACRLLEVRDHGIGQFVVPVDDAERARGRERVGDDRRRGDGAQTQPPRTIFRNARRLTPAKSRLWVDLYIHAALQARRAQTYAGARASGARAPPPACAKLT